MAANKPPTLAGAAGLADLVPQAPPIGLRAPGVTHLVAGADDEALPVVAPVLAAVAAFFLFWALSWFCQARWEALTRTSKASSLSNQPLLDIYRYFKERRRKH
jgi:hypothetical protein